MARGVRVFLVGRRGAPIAATIAAIGRLRADADQIRAALARIRISD
jgi:hypothetical protein